MSKVKRIAAILCGILIVSMYVISFVAAITASEYANGLFLASIFCTIVIPIMIYGAIEVYKFVHRNDNPKDNDYTAK